jgi:fumarylacetoacetate (FAA) hydrolase
VTPDELGNAWRDSKVHLPLRTSWNGRLVGQPDAGVDMTFNFAQLIAHLAQTRTMKAGSIVGSGIVSNRDASRGYASIAEQRSREVSGHGEAVTAFMRFGDVVRIEMLDEAGKSIFGAVDQKLALPG